MENIVNGTNDNFGSIRDILFLPFSDVDFIPEPNIYGSVDAAGITLSSGVTAWNYFRFSKETSEFEQPQQSKDGLIFYKQKLDCLVAKDCFLNWMTFCESEYRQFLVLMRDYNGYCKMMGEINKDGEKVGPVLAMTGSTGKKWASLNHHTASFYFEYRLPARFIYNFHELIIKADATEPTGMVSTDLSDIDDPPPTG